MFSVLLISSCDDGAVGRRMSGDSLTCADLSGDPQECTQSGIACEWVNNECIYKTDLTFEEALALAYAEVERKDEPFAEENGEIISITDLNEYQEWMDIEDLEGTRFLYDFLGVEPSDRHIVEIRDIDPYYGEIDFYVMDTGLHYTGQKYVSGEDTVFKFFDNDFILNVNNEEKTIEFVKINNEDNITRVQNDQTVDLVDGYVYRMKQWQFGKSNSTQYFNLECPKGYTAISGDCFTAAYDEQLKTLLEPPFSRYGLGNHSRYGLGNHSRYGLGNHIGELRCYTMNVDTIDEAFITMWAICKPY